MIRYVWDYYNILKNRMEGFECCNFVLKKGKCIEMLILIGIRFIC